MEKIGKAYKSEAYSEICPNCDEKLVHADYMRVHEGEHPNEIGMRDYDEHIRISVCACGNVVLRGIYFDQKGTVREKTKNISKILNNNQYKFEIKHED